MKDPSVSAHMQHQQPQIDKAYPNPVLHGMMSRSSNQTTWLPAPFFHGIVSSIDWPTLHRCCQTHKYTHPTAARSATVLQDSRLGAMVLQCDKTYCSMANTSLSGTYQCTTPVPQGRLAL
jgi:hypothetical protein